MDASTREESRNPLRALRYGLMPTAQERMKRSARDFCKNFLLQRELAARIGCSEGCVRQCEKEECWPKQTAVRANAEALKKEIEK